MPSLPKRKSKSAKRKLNKNNNITIPISHSPTSPTLQLRGIHDPKFLTEEGRSGGVETVPLTAHSTYYNQYISAEEEQEKEKERDSLFVVQSDNNEMEDSPNGRVEETQKVEVPDDEKEVDGEEAGDQKHHDESEREIVLDENSEPVNKACDGDDSSSSSSSSDAEVEGNQNSPDLVDDSKISQEEKEIPVTVIESIEPAVSLSEELTDAVETPGEKSGNPDITELDSKEIEENITQSLDQTNGVSPVIEDVVSNGAEEKTPPSSNETKGICPAVTDYAVSKGIEEAMLQSLDEYGGVSSNGKDVASKGNEEFQAPDENGGAPPIETQLVLKGIEETTVHYVDENNVASPAVTDFKSKGIEETKSVDFDESKGETSGNNDFASKNSVDELLQVSANVPAVGTIGVVEHENKHEIPESAAENPPIISLRQRTVQPTSWRSCCGLLEVLRRNR